jgi:hypothetical protein
LDINLDQVVERNFDTQPRVAPQLDRMISQS